MNDKAEIHHKIYYILLILLAISLPLSRFSMSVCQFLLAINWLAEMNFQAKFRALQKRKTILLLVSILLIHIIWLINTTDFYYAWSDIKMKLPLLSLPVIIGTSKTISSKQFSILMSFFIASVTISTMISTGIYSGIIEREIVDIRDISIYISHIRFALLINISIFTLCYYIFKGNLKPVFKGLCILLVLWLIFFLVILQSMTGLIILITTAFIVIGYMIITYNNNRVRIPLIMGLVLIPVSIFLYVSEQVKEFYTTEEIDLSSLPRNTDNGNTYRHDTTNRHIENGNFAGLFICEAELKKEWNLRSKINYAGYDKKGQHLRNTLITYITSKGLRKDSAGVSLLTANDINLIENGETNYRFSEKLNPAILLYKIIWQINMYNYTGNPSGHSVTQRLEFLKAAFLIIRQNFLFGVGTGDVKVAYEKAYMEMKTHLEPSRRYRAHNQLVTFLLTFGVFGFIWLIIALFLPLKLEKKGKDYFFMMFLIIAMLSMMNEDTLENQAGITFFVFFYCIFIFRDQKDKLSCKT